MSPVFIQQFRASLAHYKERPFLLNSERGGGFHDAVIDEKPGEVLDGLLAVRELGWKGFRCRFA